MITLNYAEKSSPFDSNLLFPALFKKIIYKTGDRHVKCPSPVLFKIDSLLINYS